MTEPLTYIVKEHVAWSLNLFRTLTDGGTWAVPRSGMIFKKQGNALVLIMSMPHDPAMPITPEQLTAQQDSDYKVISENFGAAGIEVRKEAP